MSFQFNPNVFANLSNVSGQYSGGDKSWLKLTRGMHNIRVLGPWSEEGSPTRMIVNHHQYKDKDGNIRNPMCYHYCFTNENIMRPLMQRQLIKIPDDLQIFEKLGCILCRISEIKKNMEGKSDNNPYAKPTFLWNVIHRGNDGVFKFSTSGKKFYNFMLTASSAFRNMFDYNNGNDIIVNVTGEKKQTRYEYQIIPTPSPIGIDLNTHPLHNLDDAMAQGYKNIHESVELIVNTYPNMMQLLGLQSMSGNPAF